MENNNEYAVITEVKNSMQTRINYHIWEDGQWIRFCSETYDTIERIPKVGEKVTFEGMNYEVQDVQYNTQTETSEILVKWLMLNN